MHKNYVTAKKILQIRAKSIFRAYGIKMSLASSFS